MATKAQIARALDRHLAEATRIGREQRQHGERATSVRYSPRGKRLHIELQSGIAFIIPVTMIEGLVDAKTSIVREVRLTGGGYGLHWPTLDLDVSVPDLVTGSFGTRTWMSALARKAGQSTSAAKAEAARRNGRSGGRPRKHA